MMKPTNKVFGNCTFAGSVNIEDYNIIIDSSFSDGVCIGENNEIENCRFEPHSVCGHNCKLINCTIETGSAVPDDTIAKNKRFTKPSGTLDKQSSKPCSYCNFGNGPTGIGFFGGEDV